MKTAAEKHSSAEDESERPVHQGLASPAPPLAGKSGRKPRKKGSRTDKILLLVFLIGLSLLLYPSLSDYYNSFHQSRAVSSYVEAVSQLDTDAYDAMLAEAQAYNVELAKRRFSLRLSPEEEEAYQKVLAVTSDGIMGSVEIPKIDVNLPIYHGISDDVLQNGVGHLQGTSLPIGGNSTHAVISAHRGLPSARLFTDLDQLSIGDVFLIKTLDLTLTYEVDQVITVLPEETEALAISTGRDYCTLLTCTPYGINSHRMLVRGHRIDNLKDMHRRVPADATRISPNLVAPLIAVPLLIFFVGYVLWKSGRAKKRREGLKKMDESGQDREIQ